MNDKNLNRRFTLLLLIAGLLVSSCSSNTYQNPAVYSNRLIKLINDNEENIRAMNSALTKGNYQKAEEVRKDWVGSLKQTIKKAEEIGSYNGDDGLQQVAIDGLQSYKKVVVNEYKQLIDIRSRGDSSQADTENKLLRNINQAFTKAHKIVNRAKSTFELKYLE